MAGIVFFFRLVRCKFRMLVEIMKYKLWVTVFVLISFLASCKHETSSIVETKEIQRCDIPKTWDAMSPVILENPKLLNSSVGSKYSSIEISPNGHGVIVWSEMVGNEISILSSSLNLVGDIQVPDWGQSTIVDASNVGNATKSALSMNKCGDAMLTWYENDRSWYRLYSRDSGWSNARVINNDPSCDSLSINNDMSGFCIYTKLVDKKYRIFSKKFMAESGWEDATRIDSNSEFNAYNAKIKIDKTGNSIAVWDQFDTDESIGGSQRNIWTNIYIPEIGWGSSNVIERQNKGHAINPKLEMDENGNAYVVWVQYDGPTYLPGTTRTSIYFNTYSSTNGWSTERNISGDTGLNANNVSISVNDGGEGVVVWNEADWQLTSPPSVISKRFSGEEGVSSQSVSIGSEWNSAKEGFFPGDTVPDVSINNDGVISVVWSAPSWTEQIFLSKFTQSSGWVDAVSIKSTIIDSYNPSIKIDGMGRSLVVWNQKTIGSSDTNVWGYTDR